MSKPPLIIIRYKKDLRVADHAPLRDACALGGSVIALYIWEPEVMDFPDYSHFHQYWIQESLADLNTQLRSLNIPLLINFGSVIDTLDLITKHYDISHVFAHEESGNGVTFERDLQVIEYCKQHDILLQESPSNGTVRRLADRDDRHKIRESKMGDEIIPIPKPLPSTHIIKPALIQEVDNNLQQFQAVPKPPQRRDDRTRNTPGPTAAKVRLITFLKSARSYRYALSRPHESQYDSSRLSGYITYGNLSIKQVYQTAKLTITKLQASITDENSHQITQHIKSIRSFCSRLHWHCHFIQKLESQPTIEYDNQNPMFDTIRTTIDNDIIHAWEHGHTGIPLVDAGMRCLASSGWINFRMRATLTSFICNTCMQPWQEVAHILARYFLDYEPGIHYSQLQMQSATTGINTIRIYNPLKQMLDKDSDLTFVRAWLSELAILTDDEVKVLGTSVGNQLLIAKSCDYPPAVVDIVTANRQASTILRSVKSNPKTKAIAAKVYQKLGSRKFNNRPRHKNIRKPKPLQDSLFD